jgi:hypothetical protein
MTTVFGSAMPLQACRKVWRLPDDTSLLRLSRSDQIANDDQPSSNPHAGLKGSAELQSVNRLDQLQPRRYRSLGVILMRLRIPKVHEHAVAHVLRYEAAKTLHG